MWEDIKHVKFDSVKLTTTIGLYMAFLYSSYFLVVNLNAASGISYSFIYREEEVSFLFFSLVILFTLGGALLGVIYDFLNLDRLGKLRWRSVIKKAFSSNQFGIALVISPIVVFVVFDKIYTNGQDISVLVTCLQSGFFWEKTVSISKRSQL